MNHNYINYTVEDFASDDAFVAWVLSAQDAALWDKWLLQNSDKTTDVNEAKQLILLLQDKNNDSIPLELKNNIWANVQRKINPSRNESTSNFNIRRLMIAATAVAAVVAAVFVLLPTNNKEITEEFVTNQTKETSEVALPDNSFVYLDQTASVSYDKNTFTNNRTIKLKGQAFFEVEKGNAFVVKTDYGQVRVLGTSFNVLQEANNMLVSCYTGKVEVTYKNKSVVLNPGEKSDFTLPNNKSTFELKDASPLWVGGFIKFENASLKDVLSQIEETYKVKINIDKSIAEAQKYTGTIVKNDLAKAMQSVTWPLRLTYNLEGATINIDKQKE